MKYRTLGNYGCWVREETVNMLGAKDFTQETSI